MYTVRYQIWYGHPCPFDILRFWQETQEKYMKSTWFYVHRGQFCYHFCPYDVLVLLPSVHAWITDQLFIQAKNMVGIPADQNSPKWRSTGNIWNLAYWILDSLLYWNRYIEGFCMWNVHFHINGLSPNIAYVILMSWPFMAIHFLLLNYWLFSVQFSYHI